jgi:hypothetical protein
MLLMNEVCIGDDVVVAVIVIQPAFPLVVASVSHTPSFVATAPK